MFRGQDFRQSLKGSLRRPLSPLSSNKDLHGTHDLQPIAERSAMLENGTRRRSLEEFEIQEIK